jgi:predicted nucleic acid-binding protein
MIVVDSSVWIDFYRGTGTEYVGRLAEQLDAGEFIAVTDVIYMELLRGARTDGEFAQIKLRVDPTGPPCSGTGRRRSTISCAGCSR